MRITNIDALSALIDRLIVEEIKYFFFSKDEKIEEMEQQVLIIKEIKAKLSEIFLECVSEEDYQYLSERRTFNEQAIVESIQELIVANLNIGQGDRARLAEVTKEYPDVQTILVNEKLTRKSNELRSRMKNNIDMLFRKFIKREE